MHKPRIVFFGTPVFAAETLEFLISQGQNIVAVVSKPDKAVGRSSKLQPTPVRQIAEKYNLPLLQPDKVSAEEPSKQLEAYNADLFVVVAYGEIIRQHILDMPKLGCINVHASLLPKYRGAAPIQRSIIEGNPKTGITIMHMVKQMDAGDMISIAEVVIEDHDTYGSLSTKLCEAGKHLLLQAIQDLAAGKANRVIQDHSQATLAPKIELEECEIDWNKDAKSIHDLIRGVNPEPGAWCWVTVKEEKKRLRIMQTKVHTDKEGSPKSILQWGKQGLLVACGKQALELLEVQLEGKRLMTARELMQGIPQGALQF